MQSKIHLSFNLQYPRVSGSTVTFSRFVVAGSPVVTLALQLAALAVAPRVAELFAAPSLVPVRADAGARDGVAEGFVLTLAAVAAVGSPVIAVATWKTPSPLPRCREVHHKHLTSASCAEVGKQARGTVLPGTF